MRVPGGRRHARDLHLLLLAQGGSQAVHPRERPRAAARHRAAPSADRKRAVLLGGRCPPRDRGDGRDHIRLRARAGRRGGQRAAGTADRRAQATAGDRLERRAHHADEARAALAPQPARGREHDGGHGGGNGQAAAVRGRRQELEQQEAAAAAQPAAGVGPAAGPSPPQHPVHCRTPAYPHPLHRDLTTFRPLVCHDL